MPVNLELYEIKKKVFSSEIHILKFTIVSSPLSKKSRQPCQPIEISNFYWNTPVNQPITEIPHPPKPIFEIPPPPSSFCWNTPLPQPVIEIPLPLNLLMKSPSLPLNLLLKYPSTYYWNSPLPYNLLLIPSSLFFNYAWLLMHCSWLEHNACLITALLLTDYWLFKDNDKPLWYLLGVVCRV